MYENFYRFNEKPFSLTPDPKFLFLSKHHQGALDHMLYGIKQREGFMSIVGDVGTGKTTLCRCLLDKLEKNIKVALILNPMLSDMDLLRTCVHDLEVKRESAFAASTVSGNPGEDFDVQDLDSRDFESGKDIDMAWVNRASKKELLDALNGFLLDQHRGGGSTVLIIDEAQNLPLDVMEQLRILSNLETEKEKLLQIIFVGQLELNDKLKSPELKQLNQRISIRYEIRPLSPEESTQYINHRLLVAGGGSRVTFKPSAVKEIFKYSQGYPRLINLVCDRALLGGYNAQVDVIDRAQVNQGIHSLMGDEEKDHYRNYFVRFRLPVITSSLFFLAGLAFFVLAQMDIEWKSEFKNIKTGLDGAVASIKQQLPARLASKLGTVALLTETPTESRIAKNPPVLTEVKAADEKTALENNGAASQSETIPAKDPAPQNVAQDSEGSHRIQLYSLEDISQAKKEVQKLKEEGFKAYWKKAVTGDQTWYIVYVGPYDEASPARIHADALKFSGRKPILLSVAKSQ